MQSIVVLRPLVVLMPLMIHMLGSENNTRYLIGYYQAAMIAQHPERSASRALELQAVNASLHLLSVRDDPKASQATISA